MADKASLKCDNRLARAHAVAAVSLGAGIAFYHIVKLQELLIRSTLMTIAFTTRLHYTLRRWGRWGKAPESLRGDG